MRTWRTAPLPEPLRATFAFLEKLTLHPADVGADDAAALRAAGVSDEAARDAIVVCFLFNIFDRMADSLGWRSQYTPEELEKATMPLRKYEYVLPGMGGRPPPRDPPLAEGVGDDLRPYVDAFAGVLHLPGHLPLDVRRGIYDRTALPPAAAGYLNKVWDHAYKTTDEEVEALKAAGWTEDEIFEAVLAATVGAAALRLRAGLAALVATERPAAA